MRKLLLLIFTVFACQLAKARDITPNEALQQAKHFLQNKASHGGKGQHAPSVAPQLSLAGTVKDLYVFNTTDNQGYVIVSNDDIATPILGYSDTGSLDLQNIPDNMRAWLQGYADEIAWAKQHPSAATPKGKRAQRVAAAVKTPIAPLVQTTWDQGTPYNNLCPEYISGQRAATGCVATAMAQCMYYTEMRVGSTTTYTTAKIPSYTTASYSISVPAINSGTAIDWSNMINDYSSSYTSSQATAVAQLMYYCGVSVQMDYGPSSGAQTYSVANALKNYFGYDETTTYVDRSAYSYSNWLELIYHELSQGRPVCYGGQSSGGGHEFVCDGYQGEDYFHINWGWGGMSDNYFKLSALDPDAQGIGGSSSSDGYHYGQDAIIGIQKVGEGGTVLNVSKQGLHYLELNSISIDKSSITGGETIEITMNITNNGDGAGGGDDFDGDIWLQDQETGRWLIGKTFFIANGDTKVCKISYTPQNETATYTIAGIYLQNDGYYYYVYNTSGFTVSLDVTANSTATTDNVTLTTTPYAPDNYEYVDSKDCFYGTTLKGYVVVSNSSSNTYSGYYEWGLFDDSGLLAFGADKITVPAGGSTNVEYEIKDLTPNESYILACTYIKNSAWTNWAGLAGLTCKSGIITTDASGNTTVANPSSSYTVPVTATSVDLTGCGVTSVTKNSNPNCLFIFGSSDAVPSGLTNIITNDGSGNYTAGSITLTDGNNFYSPVEFTATNIEFTYNNTKQADGTGGWNSIILPFDVTKVTAYGEEIDWFHSASDTGNNKRFWVKKFSSDAANTVNFAYTDQMEANTPYIIALPGNHWGATYDLSGKTIKFIGENATVSASNVSTSVTGSNYRFMGNTQAVTTENIYCLNNDGTSFTLTNGSPAFRAYFKPGTFDRTVTMLSIGSEPDGDATGIQDIRKKDTEGKGDIFNLSGQRVTKPIRGLYITNGRKIVIK